MGLFDAIEKLITEHGSAAILREHISLLRTQFSIQDEKLSIQDEKLSNSALRIKELEALVEQFKSEKDDYQKQRQALEDQLSHKPAPAIDRGGGGSWVKAKRGR